MERKVAPSAVRGRSPKELDASRLSADISCLYEDGALPRCLKISAGHKGNRFKCPCGSS